ncbi:hypothetical protein F5880DRAFT_1679112 [Lentinula raphanica]|nr:hypothetical protein F5880DRAFT_1679112 [Lentinula raphanica]
MVSWDQLLNPLPSTVSGVEDPSQTPLAVSMTRNVKINRQTTVEELYHYTRNTKVEFPKTAENGKAIGHLFDMDNTQAWISPSRSFAYSLGHQEKCFRLRAFKDTPYFLGPLNSLKVPKAPERS